MTDADTKDKDKVKTEIEKCTKQEGDDKCLHVYHGFDCFRKNNLSLIKTSLQAPEKKDENTVEKKD
jgi:hypothetical protein